MLYIIVCFINSSVGNVYCYMHILLVIKHVLLINSVIEYNFPSNGNITFIFLEGQHILNGELEINGQDQY